MIISRICRANTITVFRITSLEILHLKLAQTLLKEENAKVASNERAHLPVKSTERSNTKVVNRNIDADDDRRKAGQDCYGDNGDYGYLLHCHILFSSPSVNTPATFQTSDNIVCTTDSIHTHAWLTKFNLFHRFSRFLHS